MKDTQIKLNESPKILMLIVKSMLDGQNYFSGRSKKKKTSKQINKKILIISITSVIERELQNMEKNLDELEKSNSGTYSNESRRNLKLGYLNGLFSHLITKMDTLEALECCSRLYVNKMFKENQLGSIKNIYLDKKKNGAQIGSIITVKYLNAFSEYEEQTYYAKTHQNGVKFSTRSSTKIELSEIFVYKFFELLNIGPEAHFFFNPANVNDFFILTKSLGLSKFYLLPELVLNFDSFKSGNLVIMLLFFSFLNIFMRI